MSFDSTPSATSLQALEAGHTPCDWPGGPTTDLFGQALAPVSRSAPRASSVAATMSATYGLRSSTSSASAALAASLANRLPVLLDSRGSITFALIWKAQATPQRRQICALQARGHRTSDSAFTGWPTPNACDHQGAATLESVKEWASRGHNLPEQAQMAGWQTPQSRDHKGANLPGNELTHNARPLNEQVRSTLGPTSNGSSAATARPGQLNPAFSRWLMGYPRAWCEAGIEAWHQMPTKARREG